MYLSDIDQFKTQVVWTIYIFWQQLKNRNTVPL